MSADTSELDDLAGDLAKAPFEAQQQIRELTAKTADEIADAARSRVPVATGALRESIKVSGAGSNQKQISRTVTAGNAEAYYAAFVEFGTATQAPHPFMGPAAEDHLDAYADEVAEIAADVITEGFN